MRGMHRPYSKTLIALLVVISATGMTPPDHGFHPPMPGQTFYFQCRLQQGNEPITIEEEVALPSVTEPSRLNQVIRLPAQNGTVRLVEYLSQARLNQRVEAAKDPKARPAVRVSIDGPTQSYQRWLLADDPRRNRLTSLIGSWRYMAVDAKAQRDDLLRQFETELTRDPVLVVRGAGGRVSGRLVAKEGASRHFTELKCRVRVEKFYSHYAQDDKKKRPVNVSDKRMNPAALVEIEYEGRRERRWVFSRFPEFGTEAGAAMPIRVSLDCPPESKGTAPDFLLVTVNRKTHEAWSRHEGKHAVRTFSEGEKMKVPGSQYTFHIVACEPAAQLIEEYVPTEGRSAVPALKIELAETGRPPQTIWLQLGREHVIPTKKGAMVVAFGPRPPKRSAEHK
jgi:hypothetical protein